MRSFLFAAFIFLGLTVCFGQDIVTVGTETANIRSAPSAKASVIKTAKQGESFPLVTQQGAWSKVKVGKVFGWIHGNSLESVLPVLRTAQRPYGDPNSRFQVYSDGPGTGSGTGSGQGTGQGTGTGQGSGSTTVSRQAEPVRTAPSDGDAPLKILSKPAAQYTEAARKNQIQGSIRLRVTFLSTGEIGDVVPVTQLPDGLTDQAIDAARRIRFEPMMVKGEPRNTTKIIEYSFLIY